MLEVANETVELKAGNGQASRLTYRGIKKFDYDVALSFSSADRQWAAQTARCGRPTKRWPTSTTPTTS
ncbi:hypothetical protein [Lentzea nigeriaca]|uniref:hypothetical protein n=1 Tax=Lentzea nigeriaca TaxID=1128665 RepID=UPI00195BC28D|nr:hypothetical protein [Lentzea nigeriaca]MBM7864775.1 hypothetical protein [Lentzea nigeriaca]